MKIPHHLIQDLLVESYSFREYVAGLLCDKNEVRSIVVAAVTQASGKIDAIKKVGEIFAQDNNAFLSSYPDAQVTPWSSGMLSLGLAWRKKLVESIRNFN